MKWRSSWVGVEMELGVELELGKNIWNSRMRLSLAMESGGDVKFYFIKLSFKCYIKLSFNFQIFPIYQICLILTWLVSSFQMTSATGFSLSIPVSTTAIEAIVCCVLHFRLNFRGLILPIKTLFRELSRSRTHTSLLRT